MEQKEKNRIILEWITKAKEIYMNTILIVECASHSNWLY